LPADRLGMNGHRSYQPAGYLDQFVVGARSAARHRAATTGTVVANMRDSVVAGNNSHGIGAFESGGGTTTVMQPSGLATRQ